LFSLQLERRGNMAGRTLDEDLVVSQLRYRRIVVVLEGVYLRELRWHSSNLSPPGRLTKVALGFSLDGPLLHAEIW
jgi:hypothetical protein